MYRVDSILSNFNNIQLRSKVRNDDGIDQLNHFVTVTILAAFATFSGILEFASQPLDCWNYGNYLWKHYQSHVNSYCWTHALYRYPDDLNHSIVPYQLNSLGAAIDVNEKDSSFKELGSMTYFRSVTLIFVMQAFLFKLPNLLWNEFNTVSGTNIKRLVEKLHGALFAKGEEKKSELQLMALFMEQWLRLSRNSRWFRLQDASTVVKKTMSFCTLCVGNNLFSSPLSNAYLLMKFSYLANIFIQFGILSAVFHVNFWNFGIMPFRSYNRHNNFPILVLCNFQTYERGPEDSQQVAKGQWVQCMVVINLWVEKMLLVEWFWLICLLMVTMGSFLSWTWKIMRSQSAVGFVRHCSKLIGVYSEAKTVPVPCTLENFSLQYLRNDGILILRILAANTNDVIVAELVEEMWNRYAQNPSITRNSVPRTAPGAQHPFSPMLIVDEEGQEIELELRRRSLSDSDPKVA